MAVPATYGRSRTPRPQLSLDRSATASSYQPAGAQHTTGTSASNMLRQDGTQSPRLCGRTRMRLFRPSDFHFRSQTQQLDCIAVQCPPPAVPLRSQATPMARRTSPAAQIRYEMTIADLIKLKIQRSGQPVPRGRLTDVGDGFDGDELLASPPLTITRRRRTPRPKWTPFRQLVLTNRSPSTTSRAVEARNERAADLRDEVDHMLNAITAPPRAAGPDYEYPDAEDCAGESSIGNRSSMSDDAAAVSSSACSSPTIEPCTSSSCVMLENPSGIQDSRLKAKGCQILDSEAAILRTSVSP